MFALGCGHVCCSECWELNISTQFEAYTPNMIECPVMECNLCLLEEHVGLLGLFFVLFCFVLFCVRHWTVLSFFLSFFCIASIFSLLFFCSNT